MHQKMHQNTRFSGKIENFLGRGTFPPRPPQWGEDPCIPLVADPHSEIRSGSNPYQSSNVIVIDSSPGGPCWTYP